ncbi:MAG: GDP-L-fucose synthase, partial [Fimbriimonadales bacterium]|nr:GDP-L-fucose synthase [Fimbriimonadales bacterium]
IHLAAVCGGIGANQSAPATFFYENAVMGIHLIEEARKAGVKKFVQVGTVCSYPKYTPVPFKEENLWDGYPEETNAPYGLAKKMLLVQLQAYRQQYGFNGIYIIPVNLYGPRDNFDPDSSHVIPAMIRKFAEAKEHNRPSVTLWGDGSASREFLYVRDAAEAILLATALYNEPEPLNLGSGEEVTIRQLATLLAQLMEFHGEILWDTSKPSGQPRRHVDSSRAHRHLPWRSKTPLLQGLQNTIAWYLKNHSRPSLSPTKTTRSTT